MLTNNLLNLQMRKITQVWNDINKASSSVFIANVRCVSRLFHKLQEAPLTLRGQCDRCGNIKGEPQIFGCFPSPRPRPLFPWVVILWSSLANPNCVPNLKSLASAVTEILKGKPQISGSSPSPGPTFSYTGIWWWALANPSCMPNFKSLATSITEI